MKAKAKVSLSFKEISHRLHHFSLPSVDHVVGVSRGGIVPAAMVAHQLGCDYSILRINYRDEDNQPRYESPRSLSDSIPDLGEAKAILIVDDVSVSGKTLSLAKELLQHPCVYTLTFKGKADMVLFPEVGSCVNWPWKA